MQRLAALPVLLLAAPAFAHPGHVAEAAGHSHFLALGAFAAALGIVAYAVARSIRRRKAALSD
jgi:hydrogenase/urease accessory protein HupE